MTRSTLTAAFEVSLYDPATRTRRTRKFAGTRQQAEEYLRHWQDKLTQPQLEVLLPFDEEETP